MLFATCKNWQRYEYDPTVFLWHLIMFPVYMFVHRSTKLTIFSTSRVVHFLFQHISHTTQYNEHVNTLMHVCTALSVPYQYTLIMGHYRYHELCPLIGYFPCHWVVPVDFPNTCPMKIVRIFFWINARYGRYFYTLTRFFQPQHWCSKSTYDLVVRYVSQQNVSKCCQKMYIIDSKGHTAKLI